MLVKRCSLFVSIFLVITIYFVITEIQFLFDLTYAQSTPLKLIKEEYINPDYDGQPPLGSKLYKVIIECEDTDSSCFDNIISQTGITAISAYYSFAITAREPCAININDQLCDFQRTNEITYKTNRIESRLTINSGNFFLIALNHDGTVVKSGSILLHGTSSTGQVTEVGSINIPLQFFNRTITDIPSPTSDIDQDSIPDNIELNGIFDQQGNLVANLVQMGADPCRKTILVELDYMDVPGFFGHAHRPSQDGINEVIEMFDDAPVNAVPDQDCPYDGFPRKNTGIDLIVDIDDAIREINPIDAGPDTNGNPNDDFSTIKQANFDPNLNPYFHYSLFAHQYIDPDSRQISSSTGRGELRGNDFIVSYGGFGGVFQFIIRQLGEGGTFAHELGHNLGLDHGGGDDTNCKPNYLSVMNYNFQIQGLRKQGGILGTAIPYIDYSRSELPTLNEANLNEHLGISDDNILTIWTSTLPVTGFGYGNQPLDWNNKNGIESNVNEDINKFTIFRGGDCQASPEQTLTGYNDWSNLNFNFRDNPKNYLAAGIGNDSIKEITKEEIEQINNAWDLVFNADLEVTKQANLLDAIPGDIITYTVTVKNIGNSVANNVEIIDTLPDGKVEKRQIGNLNLGESRTEIFSYKVPFPITDGLEIVNNVKVRGTDTLGNPDEIPENNDATASTLVHTPVLKVQKNSNAQKVNVYEKIKYQIVFENIGSDEAQNVLIKDTLPKGVYYHDNAYREIGPKPNEIIKNNDGTTTLVWDIGNLEPRSGIKTIEYSVRTSPLMSEGKIKNLVVLDFTDANNNDYTELQASNEIFDLSSSRQIAKDSSGSSNCINTNININGGNIGDVNLSNKGQGYLGSYSSAAGGHDGEEYYDDGYNNNKKNIECIINNNNNNTNVVAGNGNATDGNATDANGIEIDACEDCFSVLNTTQINRLLDIVNVVSIGEYCELLIPTSTSSVIAALQQVPGITSQQIAAIIECLVNLGIINPPMELCGDNIDNDLDGLIDEGCPIGSKSGGLASFSSPPTITQKTEKDLSALEKITKLKKQWLDLLP